MNKAAVPYNTQASSQSDEKKENPLQKHQIADTTAKVNHEEED